MPTSPVLLLPYPAPTDPADVPTDLNELVTRIEAVRGAATGLASLGADGKVPSGQLPVVAAGPTYARKTTQKQVVNSVAEVDLLNGEITIAAGAIGASGTLRLIASGDWLAGSGNVGWPRWRLKLGATTIFDTGTGGSTNAWAMTIRSGWHIEAEIQNLGAANSQWCALRVGLTNTIGGNVMTGGWVAPTGGGWFGATNGARGTGVVAAAVDTTVAQALQLTMQLPIAAANYDLILKEARRELLP